jgi:hypothetical protein
LHYVTAGDRAGSKFSTRPEKCNLFDQAASQTALRVTAIPNWQEIFGPSALGEPLLMNNRRR